MCNEALKEYEDQFVVYVDRLKEIKRDADNALSGANTNKLMIEGIKIVVCMQKEALKKLTSTQVLNTYMNNPVTYSEISLVT